MRWFKLPRSRGDRQASVSPGYYSFARLEALEHRQLLSVEPSTFDAGGVPDAMALAAEVSIQDTWQALSTGSISVAETTGEKPQSKVWTHGGDWFAVLPNSSGSWIWRLDNGNWTAVLKLSNANGVQADVKAVGNVTHVLLFDGGGTQLASVQYVAATRSYEFWSARPGNVTVALPSSTETATIDIDSTGRMWLAYDNKSARTVEVRYSDGNYANWSGPITVATGIANDDIAAVVAMKGQIGVFWSNQSAKRFGFRTHEDGASPTQWGAFETPAGQSAVNAGGGMADDHVNLVAASDGTLYVAVKTSYDSSSHPEIALLVRRPNGSWDNLYQVSTRGTRPTIALNEQLGRLLVAYTEQDGGGKILYRETSTSSISFGAARVLISGNHNDVTTAKQPFTDQILFLASTGSNARGTLLVGQVAPQPDPVNQPPVVNAGADVSGAVNAAIALAGSVSDDGLPGGGLTRQWSVVSGPGSVNFANANAASTTATFSAAGTYVLRLTASDGLLSANDQVVVTVSAPANTAGIVGYWNFDNTSDTSGQGNHGALQGGATLGAGRTGGGLQLSGNNQRMTVADTPSLDITQSITIAAWIKPSASGTQYIVKKAAQDATDGFELSLASNGTVFARFNQASSKDKFRVDSTTKYPTNGNTWMHVAVTYDGATIRLYVNGQLQTSKAAAFTIAANDLALAIGAEPSGFRSMRGAVDDVLLANRALSAAEISQLHLGGFNPGPVSPVNQPPTVSAGPDRAVQVGTAVQLAGTSSDDGLPSGVLLNQWTKVSGPGTVNFANASAAATSATFSATGVYVLRLTASDGTLSSSDEMSVTVSTPSVPQPDPVNQPPVVNAGADASGAVNAAIVLAGSVSDDGLPGGGLTRQWSVVSGPGSVSFANANAASTTATFSAAGTYVLRLTASDGLLSASDQVVVTVSAASSPDLVGFWNFKPGTGAAYASTIGHLGSLQGGATVSADGRLNLAASGQRFVVENRPELQISQAITLAVWVKPSTKGTQYVVKKGSSSVNGFEIGLSNGGNAFVRFNQASSADKFRIDSTTKYPTNGNTWMHVAATYDGTTIRLYINGQLQASKAASFTIGTNNLALTLGAGDGGASSMRGQLDEVLITNRALSAAEISQLHLGGFNPGPVSPVNQPPTVSAGPDRAVQVGTAVQLAGTSSDDGLPNGVLLNQWTKVSGPGTVNFANASAAATSATFSAAGVYVLRLTASDGTLSSSDEMSVTVSAPSVPQPDPVNQPPVVNAGADVSGAVNAAIALAGSVSDDGLPGGGLTRQWSVVSGPGSVSFANASAASTTATFSAAGSYVLRLTASDGLLSASDQVVVTVSAPANTAGIVGYWNFDNTSDTSGQGNHGALQGGATLGAGHTGGGLQLSGNNQRMTVADTPSLDITQSITIAAWIKPSASGTQYIVKKAAQDATDGFELSLASNGTVFARFNQASSKDKFRVDSTTKYPTNGNTWMHVAVTYDGATIRLYVNGQLQTSKAAAFTIAANDLALAIGAEPSGFRSMRGAVDDVLLANRALSAGEIAALYQGTLL